MKNNHRQSSRRSRTIELVKDGGKTRELVIDEVEQ